MSRGLRRVLILVFVVLVAAAGALYLLRPKPLMVTGQRVERGRLEKTVVNTRAGTVKACRRTQLAPAAGGQIARLPVKEGMRVQAGDLLLGLVNEELTAQAQLGREEVVAAKASAEAACLQAAVAERQSHRYLALGKTGAEAEDKIDQAVTTAKARQAECAAARGAVAAKTAQIAVVQARLAQTELRAPFAGVIAAVNGEGGEFVTPSPPGISTLPAIDLIDPSCFYVSAPVDEVDAAAIKPGMSARITLDAFAGRHFAGEVRRLADYVLDREKQARTVDVEVIFSEPADMENLLVGYSADAEVILQVREDVLRVPTEAVIGGSQLYVLKKDGRLEQRQISAGLFNWDFTEIKDGVQEGELVVTSVTRAGVKAGALAQLEETGD